MTMAKKRIQYTRDYGGIRKGECLEQEGWIADIAIKSGYATEVPLSARDEQAARVGSVALVRFASQERWGRIVQVTQTRRTIPMIDDWMTPKQTAEAMAMSKYPVLALARAGALACYRISAKVIRFRRRDVEAYLDRARLQPSQASVG
jgi:hypothetical protein